MTSRVETTSEAGLTSLMTEEGKVNYAYPDPKWGWAVPTIGVGHTGPEVHPGLYWTDEQIMAQLAKDVKSREDFINRRVHVPLTQGQFDALVSWGFNVGLGAMESSTLIRKLNEGDYAGASAEFPKWCIPDMLIPRRRRERAMFDGKSVADTPVVRHASTLDVQRALGPLYTGALDGLWGPKTRAAVIQFQATHNLVVDGLVGPKTLEALGLI